MRISLKTKISLLFSFAMIGVILIVAFVFFKKEFDADKQVRRFVYASISSAYDTRTEKLDLEDLKNNGFEQLEDEETAESILRQYKKHMHKYNEKTKFPTALLKPDVIEHKSSFYALIYINNNPVLFKIATFEQNNILAYTLFIFMTTLLFLLYFAILKSIKPLRILRERIKEFSEGNDDIDCKIKGNDEIAEVANEFDAAVKKIRALREARQLFLRNVMHEFKTPIMRGKLSLEMIDSTSPYHKILSKVFIRQENLLNEFTRIEQLGTGELKLDKDDYFLRDIIDHALDILGENAQGIYVEVGEQKIYADFDLLATAIKNLLDNALLYSDDKKACISAKEKEIIISNIGKPLEFSLEEYRKPFFMQGKKQKESRGFGFGLFISLNIFDIHDITTKYRHENDKSIFVLNIENSYNNIN
ncbi:MAG: ArsS family sensor histidine kinase [Campylobacteraceae bacterium]|jgi:two-component system OmpR family sensor kinase|nr:ArsS family sensor histidine kinase [Campylobacteraceae bacterium]